MDAALETKVKRGTRPPFIRRVTIRNYKSIAACQVDLSPLMFLVGANGAGKSNFLDALRFVAHRGRAFAEWPIRPAARIGSPKRFRVHPRCQRLAVRENGGDLRSSNPPARIGAGI
jgi:recombinational DNA repair ATPase RecF